MPLSAVLLLLGLLSLGSPFLAAPVREAAAEEVAQLPPVLSGDSRWGVNHVDPSPDALPLAGTAGARWNRWEFRWDEIEPTRGQPRYWIHDAMVAVTLANGLFMQGILISTPAWAADPQTRLPTGLYLPWNDRRNLWAQFVREIVTRYRGRIRYWEVWNEPDYADLFWPGSTADYYQLLKVTYQTIKSADPGAQVILGGLAYWPNPGFLDELLQLILADPGGRMNNFYFDILALHTYSRPSDVWDLVVQSRQKLAATVGQRPIWVNETNVPAWDESPVNDFRPYQWAATVREQASYIIQAAAYGVAVGAERIFFYRLKDTEWPEAFGLLRNDRSIRPAYVAYQVVARDLSHLSSGTVVRQGEVEQVILRRPERRVSVVWNRTPVPSRAGIGALATSATVVDQTGATRALRATAGQYQLDLAPATANNGRDASDYIVGGPPLILIEDLPVRVARAEESSPLIGYGGAWELVRVEGPSRGAVRRTASAGLAAAIEFEGSSVTWFSSKGPDRGMARVEVDGQLQGEIDLYSSTEVWELPLTFGDFGPGPHRLTVTALGRASSASTGALLDIDAFAAEDLRPAPPPSTPTATPIPPPTATPTPSPTPTVTPMWTPTPSPTPTPTPTSLPTVEVAINLVRD